MKEKSNLTDTGLELLWKECRTPQEDTADVWDMTLRKIKEEEALRLKEVRRKRNLLMWTYGVVAASIALLIGIAGFPGWNDRLPDEKDRMKRFMAAHQPKEEVEEVTLVVSAEKKIEIANNSQVAYTKAGQVHVNSTSLDEVIDEGDWGRDADEKEEDGAYNQIIVPRGRRSMVVLADNSRMWINSGSRVIYPRTFRGDKRQVFVEGEVYLEVMRDEAKPFLVNTAGFDVEVLGTSFNVSAYRDGSEASVVLVEGEVDVTDQADRRMKMRPNERVALNREGIDRKEQVDAHEYIHWVDGVWILRGRPLKEVLAYLSEYYGQTVTCNQAVADEPFYGKLFLNEELDKVLESIRQTLPAAVTRREEMIYIEKN